MLRQDSGVRALVGDLGERRSRLAAVVRRARGVARDLVVGEALRRRRARIVEVVLVLYAVGGEERAPVVVHSELAIAEGGGMVFEEGLEETLALEELADLVPTSKRMPSRWASLSLDQTSGMPSAVVGASLSMMVSDSVLSSSADMTAKREVAEDRGSDNPPMPRRCACGRSARRENEEV